MKRSLIRSFDKLMNINKLGEGKAAVGFWLLAVRRAASYELQAASGESTKKQITNSEEAPKDQQKSQVRIK